MAGSVIKRTQKNFRLILYLIIITSAAAIILNLLNLLGANPDTLFYLLFYIPIILVAYFYPRRGILISGVFAVLFLEMVLLTSHESLDIVITGLGHAGIFIIIGFVASYLVVTYSAEQRIHERLVEIVESSSDAIIGKTIDGIITDWNKGAQELYGYTAEEAIGQSINILLPPDRPDEIQVLLKKISQGQPVERYETERMAKDKRRIRVSLSISPIKNNKGKIIGASTIAHDITERKRAEEALAVANKKLQLLNNITRHDILNQIMALNCFQNMTEEMIDDPLARSYIERTKKITDTISQQISFTREYQDIGVRKPEWQDVNKALKKAVSSFNTGSIVIEPCEKTMEIYADPLFEKVFYNLIDNSLRYGEKLTRIRCTCRENDQGLNVMYEDDGIGISFEDKPKLFRKGFGRNTGLGLFLIREILAITGLTITENGEPGKGVRFEIQVPKNMYRSPDSTRSS
jgi:PAS domain S-box-containing protein